MFRHVADSLLINEEFADFCSELSFLLEHEDVLLTGEVVQVHGRDVLLGNPVLSPTDPQLGV